MSLKKKTRALAGLAAVITLLGLITADTVYPGVTLSLEDKAILASLISALLGIDFALNQIPISLGDGSRASNDSDE